MRVRLGFVSTLAALVLVLALPGTTLGATFTYTVQINQCSSSGGNNGYGHIKFQVQLKENGWSGANKFSWDAKLQHRELFGSRWYTEDSWSRDWYTFPNSGASYRESWWYSYDPSDPEWHRIVIKLMVWHNNTVLASRTVKGKYC